MSPRSTGKVSRSGRRGLVGAAVGNTQPRGFRVHIENSTILIPTLSFSRKWDIREINSDPTTKSTEFTRILLCIEKLRADLHSQTCPN